jgi:protein O-mannosyl-transferase
MAGKNKRQMPPPVATTTAARKKGSPATRLALLLGIISFVLYANTLHNGFVLDDPNVLSQNKLVQGGLPAIPTILTTPYRYGWEHLDNDLYRPLSLVTFAIECQITGLDPATFHFSNVLLFAGCVILLFLFLDRLLGGKRTAVAFLAALLFALHPIHTEVVANIKSRDELLCFFFAFLSLLLYRRYRYRGQWYWLTGGAVSFLLSLLAKETGITFVVIIPFVFFFYLDGDRRKAWHITLSALLMAGVALAARFAVLSHYHANNLADNDMIENALAAPGLSIGSRIATAILILGYYLRLLFIPYPLSCDYSYNSIPFVHFTNIWVWVSLIAYVALVVVAVRRYRKDPKDLFVFSIVFYLVSMALFTNIFFLIGTTMGERLLFFGSAGYCLALALILERWLLKNEDNRINELLQGRLLMVLLPVAVSFIAISVNRNKDWVDEPTLFKADLEKSPNDARLNYYLGDQMLTAMLDVNDPVLHEQMAHEVVGYLSKAIAIYPQYKKAHFDIGNAFWILKQYDSAEVHFKAAEQENLRSLRLMRNMAHLYYDWHKYPQAIEYNMKVSAMQPDNAVAWANAGLCFQYIGAYDSAIFYARRALSIDPMVHGPYELLQTAYKAIGPADSADHYDSIMKQRQIQN